MRGRVTYRDGRHPSRCADWVDPADNVPPDIAELVAEFRYLRAAHGADAIPMRDVRATLQAMTAIESDGDAAEALSRCDALTHATLLGPMRRAAPGALALRLRAAAREALRVLATSRGARTKGYQILLAEAIVERWHAATGEVPTAWHSTAYGTSSPLLAHAARVFDAVEASTFDRAKLAELLRGAISTLIRRDADPA
jgi:hypothetical protein